jgi:protein SCO1/2
VTRAPSALALLALVAAVACRPAGPEYYGTTFEGGKPAADFELTDQHGRPFRLEDRRGKVVVLFFGFVHCPDVCPVTLSNWARIQRELDRDDVEFVFVTVDPERDTPERVREHLAIFSDRIHGLTGTLEQLEPVYKAYGIFRRKSQFSSSAAGYVIDHSAVMMLLDREGRLRVTFPFDADADQVAHDVRRLLAS